MHAHTLTQTHTLSRARSLSLSHTYHAITHLHAHTPHSQGIDLQLLGLAEEGRQTASWSPMAEEHVLDALHQILDTERNYPLCLMDSVGRNRVGIVVGCLRKLQRWNLKPLEPD